MRLSKAETEFIKSQGVGRFATVGHDRVPHNVPVCPLLDNGKVYIGSEKNAKKVRSIQANPHAAIVFDTYRDSWRGLQGVMLQGRSRIVDEEEFKRIRARLYTKYPKYKEDAPLDLGDSVIIELLPEKKFTWGFE